MYNASAFHLHLFNSALFGHLERELPDMELFVPAVFFWPRFVITRFNHLHRPVVAIEHTAAGKQE